MMIRRICLCLTLGALLLGAALPLATQGAPPGEPDIDPKLRAYVDYLNEFSERRRSNVYFENPQSIFSGVHLHYVNVGKGNFTFQRRDLVAVGRIPLIVARVYDSSRSDGGDFGPGWRLAAAQRIEIDSNGDLTHWDDAGVPRRWIAQGDSFRPLLDEPNSIEGIRLRPEDRIEVRLRPGLRQVFAPIAGTHRLTRVEDRNGNALDFDFRNDLLSRIRGSNGRQIKLERNESGRIIAAVDSQGRRVEYRYDDSGRLSEVVDLGGNSWGYRYDESDRLVRAVDPLGSNDFLLNYDAQGKVIRIASPMRTFDFAYRNDTTTVTDLRGLSTQFKQNTAGVTTAVRNSAGLETRLSLDSRNRVRELRQDDSLRARLDYDPDGRLTGRQDLGSQASETMQSTKTGELRRLLGKSLPNKDQPAQRFDNQNRLVELRTNRGQRIYRYSEQGDLSSVVFPHGGSLGFQYNGDGQVVSMTGPAGRTTFAYGPAGKLTATRFADGSAHSYEYDGLGLRRTIDLGGGRKVRYSHDPVGNLLETRVSEPDRTSGNRVVLDRKRRVRSIEYFSSGIVNFEYDSLGNIVRADSEGLGTSVEFRYDVRGRLTAVRTSSGELIEYDYRPDEPDIRLQLDWKSRARVTADGASGFSRLGRVAHDRVQRQYWEEIAFDSQLMMFRQLEPEERSLDPIDSLGLRRMLRLANQGAEGRSTFEQPSSFLFIPAEYRSLNCCLECGPLDDLCFCDDPIDLGCHCFPLPLPPFEPIVIEADIHPIGSVAVGDTINVTITVPPSQDFTIELFIQGGGTRGDAVFTNTNSNVRTIHSSATVAIRGTKASGSPDDVNMIAEVILGPGREFLDSERFTVVSGGMTANRPGGPTGESASARTPLLPDPGEVFGLAFGNGNESSRVHNRPENEWVQLPLKADPADASLLSDLRPPALTLWRMSEEGTGRITPTAKEMDLLILDPNRRPAGPAHWRRLNQGTPSLNLKPRDLPTTTENQALRDRKSILRRSGSGRSSGSTPSPR